MKKEQEEVNWVEAANLMLASKLKRTLGMDTEEAQDKALGVDDVQITVDGNFTLVNVNKTYTGVAKFNPSDITYHPKYDYLGYHVGYVEVSKYNKQAGINLALNRALNKLVDDVAVGE